MKKVMLTYFKDTGRYFTTSYYESKFQNDLEIYNEVKEMFSAKRLPGLSAGVIWRGTVLIKPYLGTEHILDSKKIFN
jgi:hypothetical protein